MGEASPVLKSAWGQVTRKRRKYWDQIERYLSFKQKYIAGPESTLSREKFQFSFILFLKIFNFSVSPSSQNFL